MVMRTMRDNTKWIMLILTVAFVAWLVFDWVQGGGGMGGGQNPVVALIDDEEVRYVEWNEFLQNRQEQARQNTQGALSDEERHQVREAAWNEMVDQVLLRQELERLEVEATEAEIQQAFQTNPPPSLRSHPAFQTDGQFDYAKYRDFFSGPTVDPNLLRQLEEYYREVLPQNKLVGLLSQGVTVSDTELWRRYRAANESARVRYISVDPQAEIPDSLVSVSESEIQRYYDQRQDEFSRPASGTVDLVSLSAEPSAADTARAESRADSLRSLIESGEASFGEIAEEYSVDPATASEGGELGVVTRGDLNPALEDVAFSLPEGEISEPVRSPSGYHLLRVEERQDDRVSVQHILLPIRLSTEGEDELFGRMDRLEGIALREGLAAAADSLDLPLRDDLTLERGDEFVPGAGALGVAVSWIFESETQVGDLSQFFENPTGFHILELEARSPAGIRALNEVRDEIRERLTREKKRELTRERLREAIAAETGEEITLEAIADRGGWTVRESDTFTRTQFVPGLGRDTEAIGAAFGLDPEEVAGPLDAGERVAVVQLEERDEADREAFEQVRDQLRRQAESQAQTAYVQRWMDALRERAEIVDRRDVMNRGQSGAPAVPTM